MSYPQLMSVWSDGSLWSTQFLLVITSILCNSFTTNMWEAHVSDTYQNTNTHGVVILKTVRWLAFTITAFQQTELCAFSTKNPLATPRHRLEDDIKTNLIEIRWKGKDWINLAWGRKNWWAFVNMVWTFGFSKMQGTFWIAEDMLTFKEYPTSWCFFRQLPT
jgi:hypothetical protein